MEIEDFVKANPPKPKPQQTYKQSKPPRYTCMICHNQFDKPKTSYFGSFALEIAIFLVLAIFVHLALAFVVTLIFSAVRLSSKKRVCPYCKSENFVQHW
jgi:transposase-like protein